jgi:Spy/CpxP family protein refolding chaperone
MPPRFRTVGRWILALAAAAIIAAAGPTLGADPGGGYAGQEKRTIKALFEGEIAALRNGDGMGLAKAAELNSYPGPRHVLQLARELRLGDSQARRVTAIYEEMNAAARPLGAALIERERAFDQLFVEGRITPERLSAETAAIGEIQARLRAAHLRAHLDTRAILSPQQVALYDKQRGYDAAAAGKPGHPAPHRH